ncbi:MAG: hypothetical protein M4D80_06660 [Myxococcota bacterium]|nr:hypothetical protein [Myxococcota bacterium]
MDAGKRDRLTAKLLELNRVVDDALVRDLDRHRASEKQIVTEINIRGFTSADHLSHAIPTIENTLRTLLVHRLFLHRALRSAGG